MSRRSLQVVVADTFTSLSAMHLGPDAWLSQRAVLLLVVGLLLLPCCFPRNLQAMGEQCPVVSVIKLWHQQVFYCCNNKNLGWVHA
jgi:hypothetical protein